MAQARLRDLIWQTIGGPLSSSTVAKIPKLKILNLRATDGSNEIAM